VRIEFDAPARTVLLSDFHAWHSVLGCRFLALNDDEDDDFDHRVDAYQEMLGQKRRIVYDGPVRDRWGPLYPLSPELWDEMKSSWERMFDLGAMAASSWYYDPGDTQLIQATVEAVSLSQVRRVTPFTAR
jgi:hypothetical protein